MNITLLAHYRGKSDCLTYFIPFFYTHEYRDEFTGIYFIRSENGNYCFGVQINNVDFYQSWSTSYLIAKQNMLKFMKYIKKSINEYESDIFQ